MNPYNEYSWTSTLSDTSPKFTAVCDELGIIVTAESPAELQTNMEKAYAEYITRVGKDSNEGTVLQAGS